MNLRSNNKQLGTVSIVAMILSGYFALVTFLIFLCSKMFEYSLMTIFGKDVPWYLDVIGGIALNGANVLIWFICLFYNAMGYQGPMFQ